MSVIRARHAHLRRCRLTAALASLVVSAGAPPARAEPPAAANVTRARPAEPPRRDRGGGLFLLSFLVPLPVPMAFVAPASTRPQPQAQPAVAAEPQQRPRPHPQPEPRVTKAQR